MHTSQHSVWDSDTNSKGFNKTTTRKCHPWKNWIQVTQIRATKLVRKFLATLIKLLLINIIMTSTETNDFSCMVKEIIIQNKCHKKSRHLPTPYMQDFWSMYKNYLRMNHIIRMGYLNIKLSHIINYSICCTEQQTFNLK